MFPTHPRLFIPIYSITTSGLLQWCTLSVLTPTSTLIKTLQSISSITSFHYTNVKLRLTVCAEEEKWWCKFFWPPVTLSWSDDTALMRYLKGSLYRVIFPCHFVWLWFQQRILCWCSQSTLSHGVVIIQVGNTLEWNEVREGCLRIWSYSVAKCSFIQSQTQTL